MQSVCRAVIDIGTNSVKLLVAEVAGTEVRPLWEESRQTRLGQGFYETHRLQEGPIATTAAAAGEFARQARARHAASIRVIATSAARDAVNAAELTEAVARGTGLRVEIISGAQEAEWVFRGATTDPRLAAERMLLLDVGGGSTEFILGEGGQMDFSQSYALGTVRLLEGMRLSDPPAAGEWAGCRDRIKAFLEREVRPSLGRALQRAREAGEGQRVVLVGTGGSASILACMEARLETFDRERLEATRLSVERMGWHAARLWGMPLEERRKLPGLPKNRADVILTGVSIYQSVMEAWGFKELRVTTRGLRFAALL